MENIDSLKKPELLELCKAYPESEWKGLKVAELKEYLKSKAPKAEPTKPIKAKRKPNELNLGVQKKSKRIDQVKKFRK